ncbi:hypothetical protein FB451DRAFT_1186506 [Mycena latifolia]|nr:hypothetical protein FB451DRAFT_1186506 [Mycena latifolia]
MWALVGTIAAAVERSWGESTLQEGASDRKLSGCKPPLARERRPWRALSGACANRNGGDAAPDIKQPAAVAVGDLVAGVDGCLLAASPVSEQGSIIFYYTSRGPNIGVIHRERGASQGAHALADYSCSLHVLTSSWVSYIELLKHTKKPSKSREKPANAAGGIEQVSAIDIQRASQDRRPADERSPLRHVEPALIKQTAHWQKWHRSGRGTRKGKLRKTAITKNGGIC